MSEHNITIRLEEEADYRETENLTREAFWNVYCPGCKEHFVLHRFRQDPAFVPELDFVMELDGEMIGQVMYVRSEIQCDDGKEGQRAIPIMTFGPIGIAPAYKRQGYGKRLLDYSMEQARRLGAEHWLSPETSIFMENPGSSRPRRKAFVTKMIPMRIIF